MQRIAVVGSGISGIVSAHLLSNNHEVTLFEANQYLGGHTNTVEVQIQKSCYQIDTGFIVFNKRTYPNFCKLLQKLNIPMQLSEMSFSYRSDEKDFEYNGNNLNSLFSDRRNIFKADFYRFITEILCFNRDAKQFIASEKNNKTTIQDFIQANNYSSKFVDCYLVPMMASIWSKNKSDTLNCSAYFILKFYANHGLLDIINRPKWYVIKNGSKSYIEPMLKQLNGRIYLNKKIDSIRRENDQVILQSSSEEYVFDKVVIATHSDQALKMLSQPSNAENEILSAIKYTENQVILHMDSSVMPKRKLSWASWNYLDTGNASPSLTYYMNRLQSISSDDHFFVSMNLNDKIAEDKIIRTINYAHPCLDLAATNAQAQIHAINGVNNTYYVGSYWGYGFHEDGVNSAINTCKLLGIQDV